MLAQVDVLKELTVMVVPAGTNVYRPERNGRDRACHTACIHPRSLTLLTSCRNRRAHEDKQGRRSLRGLVGEVVWCSQDVVVMTREKTNDHWDSHCCDCPYSCCETGNECASGIAWSACPRPATGIAELHREKSKEGYENPDQGLRQSSFLLLC